MGVVRRKYLVWPLIGILALAAACGGGDDGGGGGGVGGAEGTVGDFIIGWERASGLVRDDIAASQIRSLLGGDLFARVEGLRPGGASPTQGSELGSSSDRLDQIYNAYMMVPISPDGIDGELFQILSSSASEDGESATVTIKLLYTPEAASKHASVGNIQFEEVLEVFEQVISGPERIFVLEKVDGDWKITEINEG
jgi:hypothetical protein